jgi:hypothetical protein
MAAPVVPIGRRLHSRKFAARYPRYIREPEFYAAADIDEYALRYTPPAPGHVLYVAGAPEPKYICSIDLNAQEYITNFNQPLVYRILTLLYGRPDVVSAYANADQSSKFPVDWSFMFEVDKSLLGEVRNKHTSRVHLSFWTPRLRTTVSRSTVKERVLKCIKDINELVDQNLHLWDESTEIGKLSSSRAISNVPAEKYKGAELMLEAAQNMDRRPKPAVLSYGDSIPLQSVGYLYASAAVQFFVALESFVNLLYSELLRPEFRQGTYERLTVRSEIDLRLVSMHVFCEGFASQPIKPGTDLWNQILELRDFRNDLVHGNITKEHEIHSFMEDGHLFFYSPATDFRGRRLEGKPARAFSRAQTQITRQTVESIKKTVDAVRNNIVNALDTDTRNWIESWLWRSLVPPREKHDP